MIGHSAEKGKSGAKKGVVTEHIFVGTVVQLPAEFMFLLLTATIAGVRTMAMMVLCFALMCRPQVVIGLNFGGMSAFVPCFSALPVLILHTILTPPSLADASATLWPVQLTPVVSCLRRRQGEEQRCMFSSCVCYL